MVTRDNLAELIYFSLESSSVRVTLPHLGVCKTYNKGSLASELGGVEVKTLLPEASFFPLGSQRLVHHPLDLLVLHPPDPPEVRPVYALLSPCGQHRFLFLALL